MEQNQDSKATRSGCPCVRKKCSRWGLCEECRKHHSKRPPYCENPRKKKSSGQSGPITQA
ncbi:hypothetical protein [Cuneatibacter caecimuris]|uniref:hypothetical protein n=1 Tax=Cuneatibacter caecimuris TaxID=1796618 RepID=UPI00102C5C33|nr:hypothetical protein [Cuneatibacter caecimuris]